MLGLDLSNAEQIEMRALRDRTQRLEYMYRTRGC